MSQMWITNYVSRQLYISNNKIHISYWYYEGSMSFETYESASKQWNVMSMDGFYCSMLI